MVDPVFNGITLEKLLKAARKYHDTGYNDSYLMVYTPATREEVAGRPGR